jgi:ribosomal protein S4
LISSSDTFKGRKFRHYYGFGFGKKTIFFKKFHKFLITKYRRDRLNDLFLSIEGRLDVLLLKLNLFSFITESRSFIKGSGVLVNSILIKDPSYVLSRGDVLSFTPFDKFLLQRKLYRLLRARPFSSLIAKVNKELNSVVTFYSWALKRRTGKSPFLMNGFPRYIEPNFNTMEFYFYGKIKPEDIQYPFKTRLYERSRFFSSLI